MTTNLVEKLMMELTKNELDVGLVVADADAQRHFYGTRLGLQAAETAELPGGMRQYRFKAGNHLIKLLTLPKTPPLNKGGIDKAIGIRLLALFFRKPDFEAMLARMADEGRRFAPPADFAPGVQVAFARDADGNMLELIGVDQPADQPLNEHLQIGLTVADLERTKAFYGDVMGFIAERPLRIPTGDVSVRYGFKCPQTVVKYWQLPQGLPRQTGPVTAQAGFRYFTFSVKDVDAVHEALSAKGVEIASPPRDIGVAKVMFAADPDGNWIEFAQRK
jgi:catechol 2,3-dioxygenase-like lactoylglutathione lyase family enzyme